MPMPVVSVRNTDIAAKVRGDENASGLRNGLVCALVVAICLWAAYPLAEMGLIDDWSYAKTAQTFAQNGHFVYYWSNKILGWQVIWGALFIKLFGFSFTVVRLSTLLVAMAAIILFHEILVRFGVNARNAVLGTLTLGLSPLFIPLAASYMTDVPALFAILLCLYLCQRAVHAGSSRASIRWLCLAAATNVVCGTVRQPAWLGVLVVVPSTGWLLRKRPRVFHASLLLFVAGVASISACLQWFARQPYAIKEGLFTPVAAPRHSIHIPTSHLGLSLYLLTQLFGAAACLFLLIYPIFVAWLPEIRRLAPGTLVRTLCLGLVASLVQSLAVWQMPWLHDVIRSEFALKSTWSVSAPPSHVMPRWGQEIISLLVTLTALAFLEQIGNKSWLAVKSGRARLLLQHEAVWLLGPLGLSYFALLLPRALHFSLLDRYLLPMMAITIICSLILYQECVGARLPAISAAILAIFALLAIAGTHDWFAYHRAALAAIDEIKAAGVPRTQIQGGFEYDGWTQIEAGGYINDPNVGAPGAYREPPPLPIPAECRSEYAPYMPVIHPRYTTAFQKMWCLAPSKFLPVRYRTWLPPHERMIYVQEIPAAARTETLKPGS